MVPIFCDHWSRRAVAVAVFSSPVARSLFPEEKDLRLDARLPEIRPMDRILSENEEQMTAIRHIVAGSCGTAPYIVFGPPGTGKTVTMVEAIKQIHR